MVDKGRPPHLDEGDGSPAVTEPTRGPLTIGPAAGLASVRFDPFSPKSLDAYVDAVAQAGFSCFGLPADRAPWLPPAQQAHLKPLLARSGLRAWHTGGGHALESDAFGQPTPRWHAARAFHRERIRVARSAGLEGIIISPPPDSSGTPEEAETHLRQLVEEAGGGLWISNSSKPTRRIGTAAALASLCRATGAHPAYNAAAHVHRARVAGTVDDHKAALRELGGHVTIRYGNLVVQGDASYFQGYADARSAAPIGPLVLALKELGRLETPILVEGTNAARDAEAVRADALRALGVEPPRAGRTTAKES